MSQSQGEKRKVDTLICDTCGIEVNSVQMMETHLRGQKHLKKIKLKEVEINSPTISETPQTSPSNVINNKIVLQMMNEVAKFNKVTVQYDLIKETGPPHCKQFEIRLTVGNEIYIGTGSSIKRAQQIAAEQALLKTVLQKPEQVLRAFNSTEDTGDLSPEPTSNFDIWFKQISAKITEDETTIGQLIHFVENVERALKFVSDILMKQYQLENRTVLPVSSTDDPMINAEKILDDSAESFRMLRGAMRVSKLAMRLFLKETNEYDLVLLCANKPHRILLNEICRELNVVLNPPTDSSATYRIDPEPENGGFIVHWAFLPRHRLRIRLTSLQIYNESNVDPVDILNKTKCFEAMTEIHRSSWFEKTKFDQFDVLRLLCHLQHKETPLSNLSFWSLVLFVHHCRESTSSRPSRDFFRGIFQWLSGGFFLPNPLENESSDNLTFEQCLNITQYGQDMKRAYSSLISSSKRRKSSTNVNENLSTSWKFFLDQSKDAFLNHFRMPPILFQHQFYALKPSNRTSIDCELQNMFNDNEIRLFHSDFGVMLMLTSDYHLLIDRQMNETNYSSAAVEKTRLKQRLISDFLPRCHRLSVDRDLLETQFQFTENDIHLLIQLGLFLSKDVNQYWISIPGLGAFTKSLDKTRRTLSHILTRRTYREIPLEEFRLRDTKRQCPLGFDYHIYDLIGANLAHFIDTPTGLVVKIGPEKM